MPNRADLLENHPVLLPLLPLLYVAWADGILTPSEMAEISARLEAEDWLAEDEKAAVREWLNPAQPPTVTQYERWLRAIRGAAVDIGPQARSTLADLGVAIAGFVGGGGDGEARWATPESRRALIAIEAALGIVGPEVCREMLAERPAPTETARDASFDIRACTAWLDGAHAPMRQRMRTLLADPIFDYRYEQDKAAQREQVLAWLKLLAAQGLGGLAFPKAVGGGGDMTQFVIAFEMLAFRDLSLVIKYGVQFGLFGGSIHQLGTAHHHQTYLPQVASLDLPGCFAMTEKNHGSNVRELETTATYDATTETFVIHTPHERAHKEYIGNAALHGQVATVFAQLRVGDERFGVHAFLVSIRTPDGTTMPGVRIEDCGYKLGLNGVDNGRLWFDHVSIPRENLLDRFAQVAPDGTYTSPIHSEGKRFFTMLSTLIGGRISVAKAGLSAAKSALTIAIRYGAQRRQFGPKDRPEIPILDYLTHQRRLFPSLATAVAIHCALDDLAEQFGQRLDEDALRSVENRASGLKAYATWFATHTIQTCREACGGEGYLAINRFADLKADTDIFTTFEGDNTVLLQQVAKGLLTSFRQSFSDMNVFGLLKYVARQAGTTLREHNPFVARNTDSEHLRDAAFHTDVFHYREQHLIQSTARRLKKRIDRGMDSFDAFIEVQDQIVEMAQAHVERVLLDRFAARVATAEEAIRVPLERLFALFALSHLDKHKAWYLEQGVMEPIKTRALTREVNALCRELRPDAVALVNAFAIPEACLAAPIAM